jgi:hypothetical protein
MVARPSIYLIPMLAAGWKNGELALAAKSRPLKMNILLNWEGMSGIF